MNADTRSGVLDAAFAGRAAANDNVLQRAPIVSRHPFRRSLKASFLTLVVCLAVAGGFTCEHAQPGDDRGVAVAQGARHRASAACCGGRTLSS